MSSVHVSHTAIEYGGLGNGCHRDFELLVFSDAVPTVSPVLCLYVIYNKNTQIGIISGKIDLVRTETSHV